MPESLREKKVLVTGATGFIGGRLCEALLAVGAIPTALVRDPVRADAVVPPGIPLLTVDLAKPETITNVFPAGFDYLFHCAAWQTGGKRKDAWKINAGGTEALAKAASKNGISRFIHLSSVAVYGIVGAEDVSEDRPLKLYGDLYGDSKILGETILRVTAEKLSLPFTIIRPGMVYGPGSDTWGRRVIDNAKRGRLPLIDGGRGLAAPIYIDDLIDLIITAVDPPAENQTFNGVGDPAIFAEFFGGFMAMVPTDKALRITSPLASIAAALINPFLLARDARYAVDLLNRRGRILNDHAQQALGWQPRVPLIEGLALTEAWLKSEGLL